MIPSDNLSTSQSQIDQMINNIKMVYSPIVLLGGIIGNSLSFIIMRHKSMKDTSTCFYLASLALADTFVLCCGNIPVFVEGLSNNRIIMSNWMDCRVYDFLNYTITQVSVWLVALVTVDRYIGVSHPAISLKLCTVHVAKRVVLLVVTTLMLINCNLIFIQHIIYEENGTPKCVPFQSSSYFKKFICPWIDLCLYIIVPDFTIFIMNGLIIQSVLKKRKGGGFGKRDDRQSVNKMTKTLLVVSFELVLCTTPITILGLIEYHMAEGSTVMDLAFTLADMLMYLNHSLNFVLYCITGKKFREELFSLLHRSRNRIWPESKHSSPVTRLQSEQKY